MSGERIVARRWRLAIVALGIQGGTFVMLWGLAAVLPRWLPPPYPLWGWVLAQSVLAAAISRWWLPPWWATIQLLFPPLTALALTSESGVAWGGAVALGLWLAFRHALDEGVPLYLSNDAVLQALCRLAGERAQPVRFLDLGCGVGTVLQGLLRCDRARFVRLVGVETAPLSWLAARWRLRGTPAQALALDLWKVDLQPFSLVYAFLSPAAMARLEKKALREMSPGSVLVSNGFPLPTVAPSEVWTLQDRRGTRLYIYRFDDRGRRSIGETKEAEDGSDG